jgi:hypothetical protein
MPPNPTFKDRLLFLYTQGRLSLSQVLLLARQYLPTGAADSAPPADPPEAPSGLENTPACQ